MSNEIKPGTPVWATIDADGNKVWATVKPSVPQTFRFVSISEPVPKPSLWTLKIRTPYYGEQNNEERKEKPKTLFPLTL